MIYKQDKSNPLLVGSISERMTAPKFRVAYENYILNISGTAPIQGYELSNLTSEVYEENVKWPTAPTITANLGTVHNINCFIIGNPSFDRLGGGIYKNGVMVVDFEKPHWISEFRSYFMADGFQQHRHILFNTGPEKLRLEKEVPPETEIGDVTDQNILFFVFHEIEADSVRFVFEGGTGNTLNSLYVGKFREWLIGSSMTYPLTGTGAGGLTDVGTVYGTRRPTRRGYTHKWDVIDDIQRREMEVYIDTVQNCVPHYIMPFSTEEEFIPSMFVRLNSQKLNNDRLAFNWFWDSPSLQYDILR